MLSLVSGVIFVVTFFPETFRRQSKWLVLLEALVLDAATSNSNSRSNNSNRKNSSSNRRVNQRVTVDRRQAN